MARQKGLRKGSVRYAGPKDFDSDDKANDFYAKMLVREAHQINNRRQARLRHTQFVVDNDGYIQVIFRNRLLAGCRPDPDGAPEPDPEI